MATYTNTPVAICSCRHICDIVKGPIQYHRNTSQSTNINNDIIVGQGNEEEIRTKLLKYQEENIRLRSVIHDVTEVNKRWQKYNQERVGYVQKLLSTIKELQQTEVTSATSSNDLTQVENTVLRKELDECELSYRLLNTRMERAKLDFEEQFQVLELQVKMHKDDWEAEKRDKEDAHRTADKLSQEIEMIKIKLSDAQKQVGKSKSPVVYVCVCDRSINGGGDTGFGCKIADSIRRQNLQNNAIQVLPCQHIVRPPVSTGIHITRTRPPDHHSVDSLLSNKFGSTSTSSSSSPSSSSSQSSTSSSPSSPTSPLLFGTKVDRMKVVPSSGGNIQRTWKLICPKCRRVFPSNLHLQFTSHIDECQENMHACSQ